MGIRPIKRVSVSDQVFEQLKNQLMEGEWKQGEKLPSEGELTEMFGVSRVTIRNALQKLTALGLIETKLGEGSYVKKVDLGNHMNLLVPVAYLGTESLLEGLEFRYVIETEATCLAVKKATEEEIELLKQNYEKMKACQEDHEEFARLDIEFHMQICNMTKNCLIKKTSEILNEVLSVSMSDLVDKIGPGNAVYYHGKILEAFEKRDRELASQIMKEHVKGTITKYKAALEQEEKQAE